MRGLKRETGEELTEMEKALGKQVQSFIEYDIEASKRWRDKFPLPPPPIRAITRRAREGEEGQGMYVDSFPPL